MTTMLFGASSISLSALTPRHRFHESEAACRAMNVKDWKLVYRQNHRIGLKVFPLAVYFDVLSFPPNPVSASFNTAGRGYYSPELPFHSQHLYQACICLQNYDYRTPSLLRSAYNWDHPTGPGGRNCGSLGLARRTKAPLSR